MFVLFGFGVVVVCVGVCMVGVGGVVLMGFGFVVIGIGVVGLMNLYVLMFVWVEVGFVLIGMGFGFVVGLLVVMVVGVVDVVCVGIVVLLMNVMWMIGVVFGVVLLGVLYDVCGGGVLGLWVVMLMGSVL